MSHSDGALATPLPLAVISSVKEIVTSDPVAWIQRVGAIVSGNSSYPVALADQYRVYGLGALRAVTLDAV